MLDPFHYHPLIFIFLVCIYMCRSMFLFHQVAFYNNLIGLTMVEFLTVHTKPEHSCLFQNPYLHHAHSTFRLFSHFKTFFSVIFDKIIINVLLDEFCYPILVVCIHKPLQYATAGLESFILIVWVGNSNYNNQSILLLRSL